MRLAGKNGWVANAFYSSFVSPVPEDPTSGPKPCGHQQRDAQAQRTYPGDRSHIPQCDEQGHFLPLQCHGSTGFCWCVDPDGHEVPGTRTPPGSTPPNCRLPGEPVRQETFCQPEPGARAAEWPRPWSLGHVPSFCSLLPPRNMGMVCAHLCTHSCYRDIET